ncbi:MAG: hypothetical protein R3D00_14515 [Bacteroidia bacterium]
MEKVIVTSAWGFLVVFFAGLVYFLIPKYEFYYYSSPDGRNHITQIQYYQGSYCQAYITPGIYKKWKAPEVCLKTSECGYRDGFHLVLEWRKDTCVFYAIGGDFEKENINDKFRFIELDFFEAEDKEFWRKIQEDSTGKYLELGLVL